jgi:hypothetical protein
MSVKKFIIPVVAFVLGSLISAFVCQFYAGKALQERNDALIDSFLYQLTELALLDSKNSDRLHTALRKNIATNAMIASRLRSQTPLAAYYLWKVKQYRDKVNLKLPEAADSAINAVSEADLDSHYLARRHIDSWKDLR